MQNILKTWVFIICTALLFAGQAKPIVLGALYNVTGSQSNLDMPSLRGAELAIEQINARGGILNRPMQLDIKMANSKMDNIQLLAKQLAANSLISVVIGLSDNNMVTWAAPSITSAGKIFISSGATGSKLLKKFHNKVFLTAFTDNVQASAAAQFIVSQMHRSSAIVIYQQNMSYAKTLSQDFTKAFIHFKGTVLNKLALKQTILTESFLQQLAHMKHGIIYLVASPASVPKLITQIRQAGIETPIMGGDSYVAADIIPLGEKVADNIYFTTHGYFDPNFMDENMEQFIVDYKKKYQEPPKSIYTVLGYDAVNLAAAAIEKAKSTNSQKIATALESMTAFPALTGELDLSANPPIKLVSVVKILNAKARIAAMVIPQYTVKG